MEHAVVITFFYSNNGNSVAIALANIQLYFECDCPEEYPLKIQK